MSKKTWWVDTFCLYFFSLVSGRLVRVDRTAPFLYEFVLIVGLGLWLQRSRDKNAKDGFSLANRSLSLPAVAVTLALSVLGTAHILGVFEMAWILGASAVWFSLAHVILLVLVCLGTGVWVRRIGVATVPELLQRCYGLETRLLVITNNPQMSTGPI